MIKKYSRPFPTNRQKTVSEIFKSPQISNLLYAKVADTWNMMVGAWVGQRLIEGRPQNYSFSVPMRNLIIPTEVTYLLEDYPEITGAVKLSLKSKQLLPGEVLFNLMSAIVLKLPDGADQLKKMKEVLINGDLTGSKKINITSVHFPEYLIPIEILKEEITELKISGGSGKALKKVAHMKFEWK